MNTQQSFINGFVKRAAQYGYNEYEAINILKAAELKGDQHKLDVDKDGKIEGTDLKKLRQRKQAADRQVVQPPAQVQVTPNTTNPEDKNTIGYKIQEFLLGGAKDPASAVPGAAPGAAPVNAGSLGAMAPVPVNRVNRGGLVGTAPLANTRSSTPPVKGKAPFFSNEGIHRALGLSAEHMTPASVDKRDKPGAFSGAPAQAPANAYSGVLGK